MANLADVELLPRRDNRANLAHGGAGCGPSRTAPWRLSRFGRIRHLTNRHVVLAASAPIVAASFLPAPAHRPTPPPKNFPALATNPRHAPPYARSKTCP